MEVGELRRQVQVLVQATTQPSKYAEIEPDCGYEWMWVRTKIDAATWSRIKSGEHVSIKGNGWIPDASKEPNPNDQDFHWDTWEFYGGINKPMKVFMDSPWMRKQILRIESHMRGHYSKNSSWSLMHNRFNIDHEIA